MPNHVKNIVNMEGITNLPLFTDREYGERQFDFNKLIPMPKTLDIQEGSNTDTSIMYYLTERCSIPIECLDEEAKTILDKAVSNVLVPRNNWLKEVFSRAHINAHNNDDFENDNVYENGKIYVENYRKYRYTTWYGWSREFWGTK